MITAYAVFLFFIINNEKSFIKMSKKIYINKLFLSSGSALFFNKEDANADVDYHDPYCTSKEVEIADEDFEELKSVLETKNETNINDVLCRLQRTYKCSF